jgi:hypothetical protein
MEVSKKTQKEVSQKKRNILREKLKSKYLIPKEENLPSLDGKKLKINFSTLENYGDVFKKHFSENEIPFLTLENSVTENFTLKDFRDGSFFKEVFLPKIFENGDTFLYQIYFDGTKIFNKNTINCYLTILNDKLVKMNKKIIYNISFIKPSHLKSITMEKYLMFIIKKLKDECSKIEIKKLKDECSKICFGYLFSIIGDNAEIYNILNLKVSFALSIFRCRCCDINTQETNENIMKNYNYYKLINNEEYFKEVKLRNLSPILRKFYNPSSVSACFLFDYVDYLWF